MAPYFDTVCHKLLNQSEEKLTQDVEWQYYDQLITNSISSAYFDTNISDMGREVKFTVGQYSEKFCA